MAGKLRNYILIILGAGFLVYFQTLFFDFSYFDDNVLILRNINFLKDFWNIFTAFRQDVFYLLHAGAFYYRPLLTISFILDAQFSGVNAFFYHFSNLGYHLIASVLIFLTLIKLNYKKELAFLGGLIFAVHPVLTQAVAWIPGRNDSLLTIFLLSSFIFFLKFLEEKKWKSYFLHLLFFLAATLTKESAVFFPIICFIYSFTLPSESKYWKSLIPGWVGVLATWFLLRSMALANPSPIDITYAFSSILHNLPSVLLYIGKVFIPINLSVLPILKDSNLIFGLVSLVVILILLALSRGVKPRSLLFGTAWFLIFLVPNFIQPNSQTFPDFLEHRIYSSFLGIFIILFEIDFIKKINLENKTTKAIVIVILCSLSLTTIIYSRNFNDRISFWTDAVKTSPDHPLAHRNLGAMYYLDGRLDDAKPEFEKALQLNPNEQMAHNNLGLIYMNKGDYKKAEEEFKKELQVNPYYDDVYFNYGILFYKEGKYEEAKNMWIKTLQINPDYTDAANYIKLLER